MTLEEIETILDKELDSRQDQIENIPDAAKLILASHLRGQIELLDKIIDMPGDFENCLDDVCKEKERLESELTKLNQ